MPRPFALVRVCCVLLLAGVLGCGPGDKPAEGKPDTPAVPTAPAVAGAKPDVKGGKKTFTREEMKTWWNQGTGAKRWHASDIKAKLGAPDATFTKSTPGSRSAGGTISPGTTYLIYEYRDLSVDAAGSGKVDAITRLTLRDGGDDPEVSNYPIEFVP